MNIHGQQSAKKREHAHTHPRHDASGSQAGGGDDAPQLTSGPSSGQTGPHSVLDSHSQSHSLSPSKSGFATPNRPLYSAHGDGKPLPLPPHVQDAWQPRTPASTYDFSSGGETPTTPAVDSDAATPDTQLADKMGRLANGDTDGHGPKKAPRRESWFKRTFAGSGSPSPTKERERDEPRKHSSRGGEHRVQKRRPDKPDRSRSKKPSAPRDSDGDESEKELRRGDTTAAHAPAIVKQTYAMSVAGFLHWVEAHPHLPSVLSFYLQLAVNLFLAGGFVYILYCAWSGIMSDVDIESSKHMSGVLIDIRECAEQYRVNRCYPDPVPGMSKLCAGWEACMNRDAKKVARASVTAKTFAKIFNSFVEEFSYKSMVCLVISVCLLWVWLNRKIRLACMSSFQRMVEDKRWEARANGYGPRPIEAHDHNSPAPINPGEAGPDPDPGFANPLIE
jgi:hypothetical protein